MVDSARKKELVREYTERKQVPGIFAVRAPGHVWTGSSRNLATAQNGIWFGLRTGGYTNKETRGTRTAKRHSATKCWKKSPTTIRR